jgi:hypothetical protein
MFDEKMKEVHGLPAKDEGENEAKENEANGDVHYD